MEVSPDEGPHRRAAFVLAVVAAVVVVAALGLGRYPAPGWLDFRLLTTDELARVLFFSVRLPRVLAALLLGAVLGGAGSVFQQVFANPLVEPGFLGVTPGAAFGAAAAILAGAGAAAIQASAVAFSLIGLAATYLVARRVNFGGWVIRLVLSGIAVSAVFTALLGLAKYAADPFGQLPAITFWLLGGLSGVGWNELTPVLPLGVSGLLVMILFRWRVNLLALDDRVSFSLGLSPGRERLLVLCAASAATAVVVSMAGIIGWLGLIVPHAARRLFGVDTGLVIPASMVMGAVFSVSADAIARVPFAGELPLGIITSLSGAVAFILFLTRRLVRVYR